MIHQLEYTTPQGLHHRFEFEILGVETQAMVKTTEDFTTHLTDAFLGQEDLLIRTRVLKHEVTYMLDSKR